MKQSLVSIRREPTVWRNDRFWLAGDHVVEPRTYEQPRVRELIEGMAQAKKSFKMTENQGSNVRCPLYYVNDFLGTDDQKVHNPAHGVCTRTCRTRYVGPRIGFSYMFWGRSIVSCDWSGGGRRDDGAGNGRDLVQGARMHQYSIRESTSMVHQWERHYPLHPEETEAEHRSGRPYC